jgi:agmatine deiminase
MTHSILTHHKTSHILPAEWTYQDAILLVWPHAATDWAPMLKEARNCFAGIIEAIARFQDVMVLLNDHTESLPQSFQNSARIHPVVCPTNDTWARDFGPLFIKKENKLEGLDFRFNGWGLKFAANKDNLVNQVLFRNNFFNNDVTIKNCQDFVLEGGSIESNGEGILLTTSHCLLSPNRNDAFSLKEIERILKNRLGAKEILWLDHGYLSGDDTDSHIDTLARFCNPETIAYVKCENRNDKHFAALSEMETQLQNFLTLKKQPFELIPLPMATPTYQNNIRLPATYANFLILNHAVLVPFYNSEKDIQAREILQKIFPDREVIGVDCTTLIKQNGSLHCITMQLPSGVVRF